MDFGFVAMQMVTVSLPILIGWCANKLGFLGGDFDQGLTKLVLNLTLPCTVLASIHGVEGLPATTDMFVIMGACAVTYVVAFAVAFALTALMRVPRGTEGSYRFVVTFGNCGFIGLPVVSAVLGQGAVLYAAIGLIPANLFLFGLGVLLFSGTSGGWRGVVRQVAGCLKTPTMIASVVVFACALLRVTNLGVVGDTAALLGQFTTPAALLLVGSSLAKYKPLAMLVNPRAYVAVLGRLLVVPLASLAALRLLGIDSYITTVLVLEAAMPVATNATLYAVQYGVNTKPVMQATFLSVLCAIVSIPAVVTLATL